MKRGGEIDKPGVLVCCLGDPAAPSSRNSCYSIVGARARKNQQARRNHSRSANPLPTMDRDTQAGRK
jgi:hypothetical protein